MSYEGKAEVLDILKQYYSGDFALVGDGSDDFTKLSKKVHISFSLSPEVTLASNFHADTPDASIKVFQDYLIVARVAALSILISFLFLM